MLCIWIHRDQHMSTISHTKLYRLGSECWIFTDSQLNSLCRGHFHSVTVTFLFPLSRSEASGARKRKHKTPFCFLFLFVFLPNLLSAQPKIWKKKKTTPCLQRTTSSRELYLPSRTLATPPPLPLRTTRRTLKDAAHVAPVKPRRGKQKLSHSPVMQYSSSSLRWHWGDDARAAKHTKLISGRRWGKRSPSEDRVVQLFPSETKDEEKKNKKTDKSEQWEEKKNGEVKW